MGRFDQLHRLINPAVTGVTSTEQAAGYHECNDKALINKDSLQAVTTVTGVTTKKTMHGSETGGVDVATSDIFRDKLTKAATGLPVDVAVLVAEFANDQADIVEGQFDDATLRKAVNAFVVDRLGIMPVEQDNPAADGMVQCRQCSYWWSRCRHPDKHGGYWPELHPDRWRRCRQYNQNSRAGGGANP